MTVIRNTAGHMIAKFVELEKIRTAGNSNTTPKPEGANQKISEDFKDEEIPANSPPPKDDLNVKEPEVDKASEKAPHQKKPVGGEPTKTPNKKVKPKRKVHKAIYISLRPDLPHLKSKKQPNVLSAVSNRKIRKLQQPMQRAWQFKAVR